jgi:hypothetical protein
MQDGSEAPRYDESGEVVPELEALRPRRELAGLWIRPVRTRHQMKSANNVELAYIPSSAAG